MVSRGRDRRNALGRRLHDHLIWVMLYDPYIILFITVAGTYKVLLLLLIFYYYCHYY